MKPRTASPCFVLAAAGLASGLSSACVSIPPGPPVKPEKPDPIVLVSFETHLTIARSCEMVGPTSTTFSPGNLVMSFIQTSSSSTNTVNGVGSTVSSAGFQGIAYKCPKDVITALTKDDLEEPDEPEGAK